VKERVVVKGTVLTYGEKWYVGEEIYSSILLSIINSWMLNNYTLQGALNVDLEEWKARKYGKIKAAIYGYTSDMHNLSINYCLLKEIFNGSEFNKHKKNLYISLLLENYFTNIRSLYDFLSFFVQICLTDKQLKSFHDIDSLNSLLKFSNNNNNKEKLPYRIHKFLDIVGTGLEKIKLIRDLIVHRGKEIILTSSHGEILIRIPKLGLFSNDNMLPNILNSSDVSYNLIEYLRKITKEHFRFSEDLGVLILSELLEKQNYDWELYSITNYCMEDFTDFMLNHKKNFG